MLALGLICRDLHVACTRGSDKVCRDQELKGHLIPFALRQLCFVVMPTADLHPISQKTIYISSTPGGATHAPFTYKKIALHNGIFRLFRNCDPLIFPPLLLL